MTVFNGPSVVNDRIALHVDFSNTKCYPGTGTDVYDLSGNDYNGTIISLGNRITFNSNGWINVVPVTADGGSVTYAINELSTDPSAALGYASGELTYEAWARAETIQDQGRIMSTDRSDYHCIMSDTSNRIEWAADNVQFHTSNDAVTTGVWYHFAGTCSRATSEIKFYINGSVAINTTRTVRNPIGDGTQRAFAIGSNTEDTVQNNYGWDGDIAIVRIYGKALSADEVNQNFEAHRVRFGV
jgi:hypothetical protein